MHCRTRRRKNKMGRRRRRRRCWQRRVCPQVRALARLEMRPPRGGSLTSRHTNPPLLPGATPLARLEMLSCGASPLTSRHTNPPSLKGHCKTHRETLRRGPAAPPHPPHRRPPQPRRVSTNTSASASTRAFPSRLGPVLRLRGQRPPLSRTFPPRGGCRYQPHETTVGSSQRRGVRRGGARGGRVC